MKRFSMLAALASAALLTSPSGAAVLFKTDFNTPTSPAAWSGAFANVGTVDVAGGTKPSGGVLLSAKKRTGASGLLPVTNRETNLGKLTLAFSLSSSANTPVRVRVESFDSKRKRTGGLTGTIYPAAPDFFQRYALDLNTLKPNGQGRFQPTAPFVQFTFESENTREIRLDNVNYATPAYYVSPKGSDKNDGRTEATAFANPQKALDVSRPGDIIDVMSGTYISHGGPSISPPASGGLSPVANFTHPGTPAAWIVLKNYPGQQPTFFSNAWNIVSMGLGSNEKPDTGPALAYLEIRGLHVRGEGDVVKTKYPDAMDKPDSRSNSNGISIDSRYSALAHDIRIADNLVEFAPACGIGGVADWLTIENNVCRSNCWTTIYATSGISVMGPENFDAQDNVYKRLIRNNVCCHNQTYEMWEHIGSYSDGNGIILDVNQGQDPNQGPTAHPASKYIGRSLVQSNLCYDNGGSGIHAYRADHVDIINNTAYMNSASVHLEYGQIFAGDADDVHIMNNILVAPVANTAAGEKPEPVNSNWKCTNTVFSHNVYFGGNTAPVMGDGDVIADPQFVKPSRDGKIADFHLRPGSPALNKGIVTPFLPYLDLDGKPRLPTPSCGAYQK